MLLMGFNVIVLHNLILDISFWVKGRHQKKFSFHISAIKIYFQFYYQYILYCKLIHHTVQIVKRLDEKLIYCVNCYEMY